MLKSLHSLGSCAENFLLIQIPSILSVIFTRLWLLRSVLNSQLHFSKACWELWLSEDQPHSDYNGRWQMALCILAVLQSSQPNPQRNEKKNRKMYAIKQIKICAEYQDMLPRPRLDLSGTPGLRPIGLSPGSWQTSLGLGSMSRYSAQILICIVTFHMLERLYVTLYVTVPHHRHRTFAEFPILIRHKIIIVVSIHTTRDDTKSIWHGRLAKIHNDWRFGFFGSIQNWVGIVKGF